MSLNYCIFILSHKRPDRVETYRQLERRGADINKVFIVIDNLDDTVEEYKKIFGSRVIVFDKKAEDQRTDVGDNEKTYRGVVYARNAVFEIAKNLGFEYFIVLDDDYNGFQFRFDDNLIYAPKQISSNLGNVFDVFIDYIKNNERVDCIAIAQGGDFIGGSENEKAKKITINQKIMNFFVCCTNRPFLFYGRLNEDVTCYIFNGSVGRLFFTTFQITLEQKPTQTNAGGLTELYLDLGTYVKSFYSVMYSPSSVKVSVLKDRGNPRMHHAINWDCAIPKILRA